MPVLPKDSPTRQKIVDALSTWNDPVGNDWHPRATAFVQSELEISNKQATRQMYEYANSGGDVCSVVETGEEWKKVHSHHYDMRLQIEGVWVFVEMRLIDESRTQPPALFIVGIKPK